MKNRKINSLKRKVDISKPKKKFILICEGLNTEPEYFRALQSMYSGALIEVDARGGMGDPKNIANIAKKEVDALRRKQRRNGNLNSFEAADEVWAVFDRDEHAHFDAAINLCNQAGVPVARSNPCFELWLVLHKEDYDRPDDRHALQRHLKTLCPEYDQNHGKRVDWNLLLRTLPEAERRASRQSVRRDEEANANGRPSTTVHTLIERIRLAGAQGRSR